MRDEFGCCSRKVSVKRIDEPIWHPAQWTRATNQDGFRVNPVTLRKTQWYGLIYLLEELSIF